jgi:putative peptidoglycan lipid II flippase
MKKIALLLMVITLLSKISGFARDISLSYVYGASEISDIYLIALTIPGVIFGFIATGITTSYIPVYTQINKENKHQADNFTSTIINLVIIISTVIVFFIFIFASSIVKIFAIGFTGDTLNLATTFTRISIFEIFFSGIVCVLVGYLQFKRSFIVPVLVGIPLNLVIIISILISAQLDPLVLPIGYVLAAVAQILFLIPFLKKQNFKYTTSFNYKNKYIKQFVILSIPVILGTSVNQLNMLVDRTIASNLVVGGISALNYANHLNLAIQGVFVLSIATVFFPSITKHAVDKNFSSFNTVLNKAVIMVILLLIPITIQIMSFSEPIVNILFGRGAFDSEATVMTSNAVFYYTIGMLGYGLREVLSRAYYALQDTKTPMINAVIALVINIFLNIILSRYLGIGGLALATSISAYVSAGLLLFTLYKKVGIALNNVFRVIIKGLIASTLMAVITRVILNYLVNYLNPNISLIFAMFLGFIFYFIVLYILKIEGLEEVINTIKSKIKRKK